ncbi:MAG: MFS transporter, partial [Streptosporangiaceae bacterium]
QALTAMAGRWWAGRLGDRLGHERLLPAALAIAAAGMAALFWLASPVAVIAGMGLFGLGFGALQNATFTLMINRMPESGFGTASAIWNLAYDAGYGAGPAAFGVFVGVTGYPIAFAFSALLMVVALPLTRRPRPAAAARSARGGKRGEVVIQDRQRPLGRSVPGSGDELDAQPVK